MLLQYWPDVAHEVNVDRKHGPDLLPPYNDDKHDAEDPFRGCAIKDHLLPARSFATSSVKAELCNAALLSFGKVGGVAIVAD